MPQQRAQTLHLAVAREHLHTKEQYRDARGMRGHGRAPRRMLTSDDLDRDLALSLTELLTHCRLHAWCLCAPTYV